MSPPSLSPTLASPLLSHSSSPAQPNSSIHSAVNPVSNPSFPLQVPSSILVSSTSFQPTHSMQTRAKNGITVPKRQFTLLTQPPPLTEPTSFKEAMAFPEWQKAMSEEYSALVQQGTWSLVPLPPKAPVIGCEWIYRIKKNSDGSIARYKARLVAQGFQQTAGVDYTKTFTQVVKQQTIRLVLSLALHHGWSIKQLDVSNAFLHGKIQEQVYLKQPQGYVNQTFPSHVCQLHKAIYGLKQAPRAWYDMLSNRLLHQGFSNSKADSSLFILVQGTDLVYVLVYVEDILITGSKGKTIRMAMHISQDFIHFHLSPHQYPQISALVFSHT